MFDKDHYQSDCEVTRSLYLSQSAKMVGRGQTRARGRKCCLSPRTIKRIKITLLDLSLLVGDMIFDGIAAHLHFSSCNPIWGCLTLACMILPSLPFFIDYMKTRIKEFKEGKICWHEKFQTQSTSFGIFFLHFLFFFYFFGGFFYSCNWPYSLHSVLHPDDD